MFTMQKSLTLLKYIFISFLNFIIIAYTDWRVDSLEKTGAGRDWGQEEKGTTEDKMAGWHHWLDGHESVWTSVVGDGQGGLAYFDSWDHKESDSSEQLNWTVRLNWTELITEEPQQQQKDTDLNNILIFINSFLNCRDIAMQ